MAIVKSLYPPVVETYLPAYRYEKDQNSYIRFYFDISAFNSIDEISSLQISIYDSVKNINIINDFTGIGILYIEANSSLVHWEKENNLFYVDIPTDKLKSDYIADKIYKVQIRFGGDGIVYNTQSEIARFVTILNQLKKDWEKESNIYNSIANNSSNNASIITDEIKEYSFCHNLIDPENYAGTNNFNTKYNGTDVNLSWLKIYQSFYENHLYEIPKQLTTATDSILLNFLFFPGNYTLEDNQITIISNNYLCGNLKNLSVNENFSFLIYYLSKGEDNYFLGNYEIIITKVSSSLFIIDIEEGSVSEYALYDQYGYLLDNGSRIPYVGDNADIIAAFNYNKTKDEYIYSNNLSSNDKYYNYNAIDLNSLETKILNKYYELGSGYYNYLDDIIAEVCGSNEDISIKQIIEGGETKEFTVEEFLEAFKNGFKANKSGSSQEYENLDTSALTTSYTATTEGGQLVIDFKYPPSYVNDAIDYMNQKISEKDQQFLQADLSTYITNYNNKVEAPLTKLNLLLGSSESPGTYVTALRKHNIKAAQAIIKYSNIYSKYYGGAVLPTKEQNNTNFYTDYDGNIIVTTISESCDSTAVVDEEGDVTVDVNGSKVNISKSTQENKFLNIEGASVAKEYIFTKSDENNTYKVNQKTYHQFGQFSNVPWVYEAIEKKYGLESDEIAASDIQEQARQDYLDSQSNKYTAFKNNNNFYYGWYFDKYDGGVGYDSNYYDDAVDDSFLGTIKKMIASGASYTNAQMKKIYANIGLMVCKNYITKVSEYIARLFSTKKEDGNSYYKSSDLKSAKYGNEIDKDRSLLDSFNEFDYTLNDLKNNNKLYQKSSTFKESILTNNNNNYYTLHSYTYNKNLYDTAIKNLDKTKTNFDKEIKKAEQNILKTINDTKSLEKDAKSYNNALSELIAAKENYESKIKVARDNNKAEYEPYLTKRNDLLNFRSKLQDFYNSKISNVMNDGFTSVGEEIVDNFINQYNAAVIQRYYFELDQFNTLGIITEENESIKPILKTADNKLYKIIYESLGTNFIRTGSKQYNLNILNTNYLNLIKKYIQLLHDFYDPIQETYSLDYHITGQPEDYDTIDHEETVPQIFQHLWDGGYVTADMDISTSSTGALSEIVVKEGALPTSDWYDFYQDSFSEWSKVCLIKPITPPNFDILNFSAVNSFLSNNQNSYITISNDGLRFIGSYSQILPALDESGEIQEELYEYSFLIYEFNNQEWELIDSFTDNKRYGELLNIEYTSNYDYNSNNLYKIILSIKTQNLYEDSISYLFKVSLEETSQLPFDIKVYSDSDEARMCFKITDLDNGIILNDNRLILQRTDEKNNFKYWEDIKNYYWNGKDSIFYDYTIESDRNYRYRLISYDATYDNILYNIPVRAAAPSGHSQHKAIIAEPADQVNYIISCSFDYAYLVANNTQLNIKLDNKISSFKYMVSETKFDPLDSVYPFIIKNGKIFYRIFPLSCIISLESDENKIFLDSSFEDSYDIYAKERVFREKVYDFLYNNKYFLFKSPTEGNIIIKLMDINFTPNESLDRLVYTMSCNAYECAQLDADNLINLNIQSLGSFEENNSIYNNSKTIIPEGSVLTGVEIDVIELINARRNDEDNYYYFKVSDNNYQKIININNVQVNLTVSNENSNFLDYVIAGENYRVRINNANTGDNSYNTILPLIPKISLSEDFILDCSQCDINNVEITFDYDYQNFTFNNDNIDFKITSEEIIQLNSNDQEEIEDFIDGLNNIKEKIDNYDITTIISNDPSPEIQIFGSYAYVTLTKIKEYKRSVGNEE